MPAKKFIIKKFSTNQKSDDRSNTATRLIIVESPSKCGKIESFLGPDYCCIASMGHIRYIDGLKSIKTTKNYEIDFKISKDKEDHVAHLRKIVAKFDKARIYLASDDDREGEAIAWHICQVCELDVDTTKRIIFHEITEPAIKRAVASPTIINMALVHAQQARQVLDMLVGFKVSPVLWKYIYRNQDNSLSAGRCQTPALRLVYDNEKMRSDKQGDKQSDKPNDLNYTIKARFVSTGSMTFTLEHSNDLVLTDKHVEAFLEQSRKPFRHQISVGKSKRTTKQAPTPFSTSRLLQTASNRLHMSPTETMSHCQKLYQDGHITYMRTDSTKYSKEFLTETAAYISATYDADHGGHGGHGKHGNSKYVGNLDELENKDSANPHEAIRVTHIERNAVGIIAAGSESDKSASRRATLYKLIWQNTVQSCMAPAIYDATKLTINAPNISDGAEDGCETEDSDETEDVEYEVEYAGVLEVPIFMGWKMAIANKTTETVTDGTDGIDENDEQYENGEQDTSTLSVEMGQALLMRLRSLKDNVIEYSDIASFATMPRQVGHYTEASLIKRLEELGIGRPSTFAMLVSTIQDRGYVKCQDVAGKTVQVVEHVLEHDKINTVHRQKTFGDEKRKLVIQPVGVVTVEFLVQHFAELFSYDYTKHMEEELDAVSSGSAVWHELCGRCDNSLKEWLKPIASIAKESYEVQQDIDVDTDLAGMGPNPNPYVVAIEKYGPVLKRISASSAITDTTDETATSNGGSIKFEYRKIKHGLVLDMDKLRSGQYRLSEIMETPSADLGEYEGETLTIKHGKFGPYVQWGEKTLSLKGFDGLDGLCASKTINPTKTNAYDLVEFIETTLKSKEEANDPKSTGTNAVGTRNLNQNLSVRVGKYGPYILYRTPSMKKPTFYNMKKFKQDYRVCDVQVLIDWINTTYGLR